MRIQPGNLRLNGLTAEQAAQYASDGFVVVSIEAPEKRSLPALLIPHLRSALLKLDRVAAVGDLAKQALKILSEGKIKGRKFRAHKLR